MHAVTQLGTIGSTFAPRFRLVVRYAPWGAALAAPAGRADVRRPALMRRSFEKLEHSSRRRRLCMPWREPGGLLKGSDPMSETLTRMAVAQARRTASSSVTFLKAAAGIGRSVPAEPEPAIEPAEEADDHFAAPSVISSKAEMTGAITTPEELHVQGKIEGDIRASKIVVCAGGVVKGVLTADVIIIHGAVEGRVEAQDVLLCGSAVVHGDITHRSLGIDTTVAFEGNVKRRHVVELSAAAAD
jgi:cytoskeletal protein CcmA (bactofilin family)